MDRVVFCVAMKDKGAHDVRAIAAMTRPRVRPAGPIASVKGTLRSVLGPARSTARWRRLGVTGLATMKSGLRGDRARRDRLSEPIKYQGWRVGKTREIRACVGADMPLQS